MAGFFARIKSQMQERDDAETIQAIPIEERPILAYAEDEYSWNQLAGYLETFMAEYGRRVVYVTSQADDPRLTDHDPLMSVYSMKETLPKFLPEIDSPVFFTTMPDLDSFHLSRPRESSCVYAFHSLNSIHRSYRTGAFDAYDVFFCVGPHHKEELTAHFARIGRTGVDLREVGYYKLDRIADAYDTYEKRFPDTPTVLIAPSWGDDNVLAVAGEEMITPLVDAGYRVIVRPHPAFFESIYPEGSAIISSLERSFKGSQNLIFEKTITTEDSFMEADVMISDWSGAAFEYAFATERPVLFIDVPPKVKNDDWQSLNMSPFEDHMRSEVGVIVQPGDVASISAAIGEMLSEPVAYRDHIASVRDHAIYNFGSSATAGASILNELSGR